MATNRAAALQIIDPVLTGLARRYQPHGFIYDQVINEFPVQTLSFQYPVFDKAYWFGNEVDNEIRDRAAAKEIDFSFATESALAKEWGLKVSITDLERAQAHPSLRLEQSKNDFLSLHMTIAREKRLSDLLFPTDVATTISTKGQLTAGNSATPANKWDTTSSNPEADIRAGALAVYNTIGYRPNMIVIPFPVAYNLATIHGTDTFRNQMIYTVNGQDMIRLGDAVLPSQIHGMKVVIPNGPQINTANEGAAASISEIWGKHVRLLYVEQNAPWGTPTVVYNFRHTATTTLRWRQQDPDIDYVRQMERCIEKVVAPDAGYALTNVIS